MEQGHRLSLGHRRRKLVDGHVGPTPRAVDGEEADPDAAHAVRRAVVSRQQLVRHLRRRVHVARPVDGGRQTEGDGGVLAVHTGAGRVDEPHQLGGSTPTTAVNHLS